MFNRPGLRCPSVVPMHIRVWCLVAAAAVLAPLAALTCATPAAAQTVVRGRVVEEGGTMAIRGAVVTLFDEAGVRVRGVLTSGTGAFAIPAPAPGRYRLRAEMIGRESVETDVFDVAGDVPMMTLTMSVEPIRLDGIDVTAASRCSVGADVALATHAVWEEVQKALRAESVTRDMALYEFGIERVQRIYDPNTMRRLSESKRTGTSTASNPFSTLPPEVIAESGYTVGRGTSTMIYGPDTDVLLSPGFQETHCFGLREDRRRGRIGLTFKPVSGRKVTDIEGVLWIDGTSNELLRLEFTYRNIPRDLLPGKYSGFAEFQRLESGAWIINRWRLSTPAAEEEAEVQQVEAVSAQLRDGP